METTLGIFVGLDSTKFELLSIIMSKTDMKMELLLKINELDYVAIAHGIITENSKKTPMSSHKFVVKYEIPIQ